MRPVRQSSMALDLPTKRVRRCVPPEPGMVPMVISGWPNRSEEHTSELQSLMRISYAVFCLKKKKNTTHRNYHTTTYIRTKGRYIYYKQENNRNDMQSSVI